MQENPGVGNADNSTFTHQKDNPDRSASMAVSVSHFKKSLSGDRKYFNGK